jgi:hypothetical protein
VLAERSDKLELKAMRLPYNGIITRRSCLGGEWFQFSIPQLSGNQKKFSRR